MPQSPLNHEATSLTTGRDGIVIVRDVADIPGGSTLDCSDFTPDIIEAGHIIIQETATGTYKPHPIEGKAYAATPSDHVVVGVLKATIAKVRPTAAILVAGQVNAAAAPFPITKDMADALRQIHFLHRK